MTLTLVNWNVERATPRSPKWKRDEILGRIESHNPDVICLTETDVSLLSKNGCAIYPQIDQASEKMGKRNQRKVLLWSRELWEQVDLMGNDSLRPGRFVAGVTHTSVGDAMVVGVCIPWRDSPYVGSGVPRWKHHRQYSEIIHGVLKEAHEKVSGKRLIIMGDFNLQLGLPWKSSDSDHSQARLALENAIPSGMTIVTRDIKYKRRGVNRRGIDHIALSDDLRATSLRAINDFTEDGMRLSDSNHFGVVARANTKGPASED